MHVKQVIVMRTEFPDRKGGNLKLRRGKEIAQGSHASQKFLVDKLQVVKMTDAGVECKVILTPEEYEWMTNGRFTKVTTYVRSEQELMEVYRNANLYKVGVKLIEDSGKTEFDGIPTKTCLAIGPADASLIDPVSGKLPLY